MAKKNKRKNNKSKNNNGFNKGPKINVIGGSAESRQEAIISEMTKFRDKLSKYKEEEVYCSSTNTKAIPENNIIGSTEFAYKDKDGVIHEECLTYCIENSFARLDTEEISYYDTHDGDIDDSKRELGPVSHTGKSVEVCKDELDESKFELAKLRYLISELEEQSCRIGCKMPCRCEGCGGLIIIPPELLEAGLTEDDVMEWFEGDDDEDLHIGAR